MRLVLLDALSEAAGEITRDLAPGSVDLRLRDREPSFVVSLPPGEPMHEHLDEPDPVSTRAPAEADDAAMVRINLRLTQDLKDRVEDAAREAGLSVNAWLVRSAVAALEPDGGQRRDRREAGGGARYRGWVR